MRAKAGKGPVSTQHALQTRHAQCVGCVFEASGLCGRREDAAARRCHLGEGVILGDKGIVIVPAVNLQSITTDTTPVLNAISTLTAAGGGGFSEANLVALFQVATDPTIGFRTWARKIIVYFGDAPGHEPTCFDSTVLTRDDVVLALSDITVVAACFVAACFGGGLDAVPTAFGCPAGSPPVGGAGQGTFITDGTGGTLVDSADQAALIDSIIEAVGTLDQEISADTSDCDGNVGVTFDPPLPLMLAPGESVILNETIMIMEGVCDEDPGFSCTVNFIASGGILGGQTITTTTEIGCP